MDTKRLFNVLNYIRKQQVYVIKLYQKKQCVWKQNILEERMFMETNNIRRMTVYYYKLYQKRVGSFN